MADFICRWALEDDLECLIKLEAAIFVDAWTRTQLLPELKENPSHVLLLEKREGKENEIVGYVLFWQVVDELQLHRIAIIPENQGQGLGQYLWSALLAYCVQNDIRLITLEVRETNIPAQKFYQRRGFYEVGRRPRYYQDTGEAAILMDCSLVKQA